MGKKNTVFIAKSLDGYIADKNGGLEWLGLIPNPNNTDMGFESLMNRVDALLMGRTTFETVCRFDIDWPYIKPVFVLSRTMGEIPEKYKDKAELVNGALPEVLDQISSKGFHRLYIDGGSTIQSFLKEDLIDELIITTIPILLGGGAPLFSELPKSLELSHVETKIFLNEIVQSHYHRKK